MLSIKNKRKSFVENQRSEIFHQQYTSKQEKNVLEKAFKYSKETMFILEKGNKEVFIADIPPDVTEVECKKILNDCGIKVDRIDR
eukprot:UN19940